ncbi:MAG: SEL1-like repeat protein [Synergistaceae bacterium]|nr:SEL1-like repeat protein [Synergistaceae bacterium]
MAALTDRAAQGDAEAQYRLGTFYHTGRGVEQNYARAAEQYAKAAFQGHAKAQFYIGALYQEGKGLPRDYEQAAIWYRRAALQGEPKAQYYLGLLYRHGLGVEKDDAQARAWIAKAAAQGEDRARDKLAEMDAPKIEAITPAKEAASPAPTRPEPGARQDGLAFRDPAVSARQAPPVERAVGHEQESGVKEMGTPASPMRKDRMKLISAYILFPLINTAVIFYLIDLLVSLRAVDDDHAAIVFSVPYYIFAYIFATTAFPTIIRFFVEKRGVSYGAEAWSWTVLSIIICHGLVSIIGGKLSYPGFLDIFSAYNILTYKTEGANTTPKWTRRALNVVSFVALVIWGGIIRAQGGRASVWLPFAALSYILEPHTKEDEKSKDTPQDAPTMDLNTAYFHLGLSEGATMAEIDAAHWRKMALLDPSAFPQGSPEWEEAARMSRDVDRAYQRLHSELSTRQEGRS